MNVDVDVGIVLGRASMDWRVVVDNVLGDHARDSLVARVAEVSTWVHHTLRGATVLLEHYKVCRHVKLEITAAAGVVSPDHHDDALIVLIG